MDMRSVKIFRFVLMILCFLGFFASAEAQKPKQVDVRIVSDEARAVLSVLEKRKANQAINEADWQKIFSSEGYVRLKERELSLKRDFADEDFKKFVLSDDLLGKYEALRKTLIDWERLDASRAAKQSLKYLPADARIRAKIYPVIKPRDNSFVFDIGKNPAIFLYLDPNVTREQFENTLTHELHHIGYGTACPRGEVEEAIKTLASEKREVFRWMSAFGEGLAMLAAAGSPHVHPHKFSKSEDRARWDKDVKNFNEDLKKVESFFQGILARRIEGDKISEAGFSFFGVQGAWYTVGWKMSVVIEQTFGRQRLIEVFCDGRKLLPVYNEAAPGYNKKTGENLALWSPELINYLK
jgi:hypothetical protein